MSLSNPYYGDFAETIAAAAQQLGIELVINDPKSLLGVLNVHTDQPDALDVEDRLSLEGIAGQLAMAIEKARLLEEANIFRRFAEESSLGLGMATLEGEITYINPALAEIIGVASPELAIGKSFLAFYSATSQERLRQEILPQLMRTGAWVGESELQSVAGKTTLTLENLFLIRDDNGTPLHLVTTISDITERKQSEAELEARLQELKTLQRLMTREGWQEFQTAQPEAAQGYLFDRTVVQPLIPAGSGKSENGQSSVDPAAPENGHIVARPVAVQGEVIGALGVYDDPDQPLTGDDQEFLDAVAQQVAEAMDRARLLEQMQKRATELETVAEVSTVASTTLDVTELLQTVVDLTKMGFDFYHAHIFLFDEANQQLVLAAGADQIGRQLVADGGLISLDQEQSLVARAARTLEAVLVNDVQKEAGYLPHPLLPETRSELAIPMIVGNELVGVFDFHADRVDRFTTEDKQIQTTLAAQVASAVRNAQRHAASQEATRQLTLLNELETAMSQSASVEDVLNIAADKTPQILQAERVSVALLMADSDYFEIWALRGEDGAFPLGSQVVG